MLGTLLDQYRARNAAGEIFGQGAGRGDPGRGDRRRGRLARQLVHELEGAAAGIEHAIGEPVELAPLDDRIEAAAHASAVERAVRTR